VSFFFIFLAKAKEEHPKGEKKERSPEKKGEGEFSGLRTSSSEQSPKKKGSPKKKKKGLGDFF